MSQKFDPNLLQWYDGMPLSCHHFQQSDVRNQKALAYLLDKISPYSWGILELEIEITNMSSNLVNLKHLECIMPDYSIVFFPMYDEEALQIEIESDIAGEFYVYCSLSEDYLVYESANQRYKSVLGEPVYDLNTGENKEAMVRLSPAIQVTTRKINDLSIPIAKMISEFEQLKSVNYDPPSPIFDRCTYSRDLVSKSIADLSQKMNNAYSKLKVKGERIDFEEYGRIILERLLPFQLVLESKNASPFVVYMYFIELALSIASIEEVTIPHFDAKYNHEDILESFKPIAQFIEEKIKMIDNRYASDLNRFNFKDAIYSHEVDKSKEKVLVMMHFREDFEEWIENAVIVSDDKLAEAQMMRIIGCKRKIIDSTKKEMKKNETIIFVKVEILLESDYVLSSTLLILNPLEGTDNLLGIYIINS